MTYIVSKRTNGKPGNCALDMGAGVIECKATGDLCIVHKDDEFANRNRKRDDPIICPFTKHDKVVFEYEKKESE